MSEEAKLDVISSKSIDYTQKMFSHPNYKLIPVYPNTFGAPIILGAGQVQSVMNLPSEVFNLSKSYIAYTVTLPIAGANITWVNTQLLAEISHMQFYGQSNQYIADIDNLQNYNDIVAKKEIRLNDFLTHDGNQNLYPSNSVNTLMPALRNSNDTNVNVAGGGPLSSSRNYTEPAYFWTPGVAGAVVYNVIVPLNLIKNSIFSVDKNLYFNQTTYLRTYFGPLSKFVYQSNDGGNPTGGAKAPYVADPPADAKITNFTLYLATESNNDLRTMIINKVNSEGLNMLIPYVQSYKTNNQGTSQTITIQFDSGNGRSLMRIYHSLYSTQESLNTAFARSNDGQARINNYYTQLNSKRLQDLTLDCTAGLDWIYHKESLKGSITQTRNIYNYNWFHCDDFCSFENKDMFDNDSEKVSGLPLVNSPVTWSFVGANMPERGGDNANNHYTYAVFLKKLSISSSGVMVQ